jgi:hypothetical protein
MKNEDWKQKLDYIATRNGCKVVDYNLAWFSKQKGYREEWLNAVLYFSAGLLFGAFLIKTFHLL